MKGNKFFVSKLNKKLFYSNLLIFFNQKKTKKQKFN